MANLNKTLLIGRLTQNPELKTLPTGANVCNFSIATNKNWLKDGKKQEKTEWHNIVVWGKLAELCNTHLAKGSQAFVEGELQTRSWEDKEGKKRYTTEINANVVQFLSNNSDTNNALKQAHESAGDYQVATETDFASDEIPF